MAKFDATIVEVFGDPFTQDDVEEFFIENIPFGDEATSTAKPKDPKHAMSDQSRSSSIWGFHFHSYVLTIYVRLYWLLELVVFYSLVRRRYIRKVSLQLVPKYFSRDCSTDSISCNE